MTVRYGFIGAGAISHSSAQAVQDNENSQVVAAWDPSAPRLKELCEAKGIATQHDSAESLLADPNVDAVYIAVPNKFHAPYAKQALEAGKHVILDKPFAMNVQEALGVAAAVKSSGKKFTLGMNQRFRSDSQKIHSIVQDGVLGEIYHAKAFWFRRSGIPRLGTWFGNKELAGGGALLDIGVHLLDVCLHTMGNFEPVAVMGATYTKFGNRGLGEGGWGKSDREDIVFDVDDFASALIRMKNGATVSLDITWACHTAEPNKMDVHLFGTEGGASLYPAKVFRNDPLRTAYDIVEDVRADVPMAHEDRFANFTNAILGTEELATSLEEALAVQRILDGIYESLPDRPRSHHRSLNLTPVISKEYTYVCSKNFGVQSYCFRHFKDNAVVAQKVREIGLDKIELCAVHADFSNPEAFKDVVKIYADAGVSIVSIGVQTFTGADVERKWFECAKIAGAKFISCHFQVATYITAIPKVRELSREFGIKAAIHSHGGYMFGGSPDVLRHLIGLGGPEIGVCIDTAWAMQIGPHQGNPVKWVEQFGPSMYGVHYKDFVFGRNGQWEDVVVGTGNLDLPAFVGALEAANFGGFAVIEYEADVENPVPALTKCVESMRAAF